MRRLILMRHAKSSWDNLNLSDHERTLNERGRNDCPKIASWLVENGYIPNQVIVSSAKRCMETWERVGLNSSIKTDAVQVLDALYHSTAERMLGMVQEAQGDVVLMIAHNPGIGDFASRLHGDKAPAHPKFRDYPTAATTVIDFDINDWADAKLGTGTGVNFTIPRDL